MKISKVALFFLHGYWSFVRKTYGDAHSKTGKVSNLVNGPVPWNEPPPPSNIEKFFNFNSEFRIKSCKSCGIDPPPVSAGNLGNSTFS